MKYVEAIDILPASRWKEKSLFLGGGISNCPDWQSEVCRRLEKTDLTILNPRRKNFPIDDPEASESQIIWEFDHMGVASAIVFWFCSETVCPISLFEYGKWIVRAKQLFVGCHPSYTRLSDIQIQTRLSRPYQKIHTNLEDLIKDVEVWAK